MGKFDEFDPFFYHLPLLRPTNTSHAPALIPEPLLIIRYAAEYTNLHTAEIKLITAVA